MSFPNKKMMSVLRQNYFDNNGQRITLLHYDDRRIKKLSHENPYPERILTHYL